MKNSYYSLFACFILLATACDKTISSDAPLTVVKYPSVIVPTDNGFVYAFNAETGAKIWEYNLGFATPSMTTPVIDFKENLYFATNGTMHSLSVKTGKVNWVVPVPQSNGGGVLYDDYSKLYVGGDSLYCFNENGTKLWGLTLDGNNIVTTPTYKDGFIYVAAKSKIYCVDPNLKFIKWTYDAGSSEFKASPTVKDGKIYCGMVNGQVKCLNLSNGNLIWTYTCKDDVFASAMVRGDMCIVGSYDDTLRCIDAEAGTDAIRWKYGTAESISSSATIDVNRETVYVGSNDFNMYAINHVDGSLRWKYPTGSIIRCSPVLYNNKIYFTSFDKHLYAVNADNGKLAWKVNINAVNASLLSPIVYNATFLTGSASWGEYPTISGNSIH